MFGIADVNTTYVDEDKKLRRELLLNEMTAKYMNMA